MRILRGVGITLGVLIALLILIAAVGYGISSSRLSRSWEVAPESLEFSTDSAVLARGRHLAEARLGCADCHTADLGGQVFIDSPVFGRFVAPNLTRGAGGIGASYTDADWVRSVRHGVAPDGRALLIMPSQEFSRLSREDLVAVISWVKSVPAVDRTVPQSAPGPIARAMVVFDEKAIPASVIDHSAPFPAAPVEEVSVEYGAYLAGTSGCRGCHGPDLGGAKSHEPGGIPPANLTPAGALGSWSEADFRRAMREGKRPDGTAIAPAMPWSSLGRMSDLELNAIFAYLKSLPPVTREI
ncbi:MAG TPA: cytochrome c [Gemmatimonadales bacterium]|nr:cytochrome c [Gemmatimonadales bacterium]